MKKQNRVASDLTEARNRAGLRQIDVAHLLGVQHARISQIENGKVLPNVIEVATLSIVYGKEMESLVSGLLDQVIANLVERLSAVPSVSRDMPETYQRADTLSDLARRLEVLATSRHAGA